MMISEKGHLYDSKDINSVSRFHSTERKNCLSLMGQFASMIFLQGNSARKLKCFGKLSGKEQLVFCTESTRYASLSQQWKLKINKGPHTENEHIIIWTLSRTGTQPSHWCIKPRECTCVPIHWFPFKGRLSKPPMFWKGGTRGTLRVGWPAPSMYKTSILSYPASLETKPVFEVDGKTWVVNTPNEGGEVYENKRRIMRIYIYIYIHTYVLIIIVVITVICLLSLIWLLLSLLVLHFFY